MSSHSANLNCCLVLDGLYRNYKEGKEKKKKKKKKKTVFRAVSFLLDCSPRLSFGTTNNRDAISDNPATRELVLLALIAAGRLVGSLEGRHTPSNGQIVKPSARVKKIQ